MAPLPRQDAAREAPGWFGGLHPMGDATSGLCRLPIELARSHGLSARELNVIRRIINTHRSAILEAWHEHCG